MDLTPQRAAFSRVLNRLARNTKIVFSQQRGGFSWALCLHDYFRDSISWNIIPGEGLKKKQRSLESEWKNRFPILIGQFFWQSQGLLFIPAMSWLELCCFAVLGREKLNTLLKSVPLATKNKNRFVNDKHVVICWIHWMPWSPLEKVVKNPWTGRLIKNALRSATASPVFPQHNHYQ